MYTLPEKAKTKYKRILAFDPGTKNMGISCVELVGTSPKVLANATMENPLHDIYAFMQQRDAFLSEVDAWINMFEPDGIIAERFQTRGLKGPTIECVSMMLGILGMLGLPVMFITASTWKNKFQKRFCCDLREMYDYINTTPHQLDASLIGCYGLEAAQGKQLNFTVEAILQQVYKTGVK